MQLAERRAMRRNDALERANRAIAKLDDARQHVQREDERIRTLPENYRRAMLEARRAANVACIARGKQMMLENVSGAALSTAGRKYYSGPNYLQSVLNSAHVVWEHGVFAGINFDFAPGIPDYVSRKGKHTPFYRVAASLEYGAVRGANRAAGSRHMRVQLRRYKEAALAGAPAPDMAVGKAGRTYKRTLQVGGLQVVRPCVKRRLTDGQKEELRKLWRDTYQAAHLRALQEAQIVRAASG